MIADPERDQWICLGHDLVVTKAEIVKLILREHGEVRDSFDPYFEPRVKLHDFRQDTAALHIRVCTCGLWPDHHVHTGDRRYCNCSACFVLRKESDDTNPD